MTNNFVLICISSPHWFLILLPGRSGQACGSRPDIYISVTGLGAWEGREGQRRLGWAGNAPHTASHIFVINSPEVRPRQARDGEIITHLDLPLPTNILVVKNITFAPLNTFQENS